MAQTATQPPQDTASTFESGCISHPGVLTQLLRHLGGSPGLDAHARQLLLLDPVLSLHALRLIADAHPDALLTELNLRQALASLPAHILKQWVLNGVVDHLLHASDRQAALLDQDWHQAVTTAALCRALAELHGYRNPEEAWLAGLLVHLPAFVRHAQTPEAARLTSLAALESIPLRGFLADTLRYRDAPPARLQDAAPLVRLVLSALRLLSDPVPDDAVFLLPALPTETLREMLHNAKQNADRLTRTIQATPPSQAGTEVMRFSRLEAAAGLPDRGGDAVIEALAASLAAEEGLYDPIYLALDKRSSSLVSQALGGRIPPAISLRMEGSNAAAVRALFTRGCVVVFAQDTDTALLDQQIIRQAQADGLAALPVGEGGNRGVLMVCGHHHALEKLAANPQHYTRLANLVGRGPASAGEQAAGGIPVVEEVYARVRRACHEVSNPLGIIKNYLTILNVKLGDDALVVDELRIIHEELDRITRIVRGMLHDGAQNGEARKDTDINLLVQDMVKMATPTLHGKGVRVDTQLAAGLPRLTHDRDALKQIVLNLLLNALEASPEGGTVRVGTAILLNQHRERFLEISITDNGAGIPPERMDTLFEPVETGKGAGHAGLGLSIVKHLTESLDGTILCKSGAAGTTFQISLPLV
ncbi:MAG TPA: ATP-binding protein [Thiobacillaceae bacterium]|nr:ATP-binding protein [Thiobacillaceae bacterium]HNU65211.1 ATP-binding protein [Thiobacillaceae bacterium]